VPKRQDLKSILIIGAGPIVIGQACEFDYSGAQACKALREEGYRVILVNSNPATIMTDPETADATYIEPITWQVVEKIIAKERQTFPHEKMALLPTMGGQTALNCALELHREGVLAKYGVEMIGANEVAIEKAEDRQKFKDAMTKIGLDSAKSGVAHSLDEAWTVQRSIQAEVGGSGYPMVIRPSFTLGGSGGGIAYNPDEFEEICKRGLDLSPTKELLIEESLLGWKEYEMEVVRDKADNCIIVCSIENLDPMGIHTGDSITVAPAQTLSDKEYQCLRNASIAILREIGVDTGGSNVQFSINPANGRMIVIEMNPRVSRSSALASKATGFPIAKIAAKLAVGYTLDELRNDITGGATPASFEPSIDYVVTKIPRFAFEKFAMADTRLTTQMKSVGEVMAMGRSFQESFQKALRGLETGIDGLSPKSSDRDEILEQIGEARPDRILFLADAFRVGIPFDEIQRETAIDPWFLREIEEIVRAEQAIEGRTLVSLTADDLRALKRMGFSDRRLGTLLGTNQHAVRQRRHELQVRPVYKRVDTCAAEFATETAYLYSCYDEECEAEPSSKKKIMVLGGGPNRIGQGIEFDYCCVHAAMAMREDGYETIMVNCNPETVSTDYDTSDRLYFEPVTLEDVLEIVAKEKPVGVIVQYGGQTPLKLALDLERAGVPIIGTTPDSIDIAEDRERFQQLLHALGLRQPPNRTARTEEAPCNWPRRSATRSWCGPAMCWVAGRWRSCTATRTSSATCARPCASPTNRRCCWTGSWRTPIEVDVDCISDGTDVMIGGIMEHIEAGRRPFRRLGVLAARRTRCPPICRTNCADRPTAMAKALKVVGLMNVQFAITGRGPGRPATVYVLEVNPRASRTVPFVSKATGQPLAKIAARCMAGTRPSRNQKGVHGQAPKEVRPPYYSVKEAVFPFNKFPGVDPILSPEMRSTGEVMGAARTFGEAMLKSQIGAGSRLPRQGNVLLTVKNADKARAVACAQALHATGLRCHGHQGHGGSDRRSRRAGEGASTRSRTAGRTLPT
jgi:carbamoyl-phosphate synthase large subunit